MKQLALLGLLGLMSTVTGCATMRGDTQKVKFDTDPSGANLNVDGQKYQTEQEQPGPQVNGRARARARAEVSRISQPVAAAGRGHLIEQAGIGPDRVELDGIGRNESGDFLSLTLLEQHSVLAGRTHARARGR